MEVTDQKDVVAFLISLGRLAPKDKKNSTRVKAAVLQFQKDFGTIKADGKAGPLTKKAMSIPRCGVSDVLPFREYIRWRKDAFLFTIQAFVPSQTLTNANQRDIIYESGQRWAAICGIREWREAKKGENADVFISTGRGRRDGFDGPGRTLAWAELPDGNDRPLRLKYDLDEIWIGLTEPNGIPFETTTDHELGHIFGLDHSTNPSDLMYPTLNRSISGPQAGDIQRMVAEYGPPEIMPTPAREYILTIKGDLDIKNYQLIPKP